jgi:membrane protein YqaA with SNARE-associated domain
MGSGRSPRNWLSRLVQARSGQLLLYWYAVLEAALVPVPFEAVLAPYMQMRPDIRWRLPAIGVAGYATVALLAYGLGALFFETLGEPLLEAMGWRDTFEEMHLRLLEGGFFAIILIVALPIPTMPVHIGAGVSGVPVEQVLAAVLLVRGARYFGTGLLVAVYGDRVVDWLRGRQPRSRRNLPNAAPPPDEARRRVQTDHPPRW